MSSDVLRLAGYGFAGMGRFVDGVDDFHKGNRLVWSVQWLFLALDGQNEIGSGTGPPHVLARFYDDIPIDRIAILLHVKLATVDAGFV
jgi:hypothetical protein